MELASSAVEASMHGTCGRRKIGCSLHSSDGTLLSVGWNGPLVGGCNCPGRDVPAGTGTSDAPPPCYGMHGEIRALAACKDHSAISFIVSTKAPCTACTLVLLGTPCQTIYLVKESNETRNRELWEAAGRRWCSL